MHALRTGPDATPSVAIVIAHRVDRAAGKVRSSEIPGASRPLRAKKKGTFHRADEEKDVAFFWFDVTDVRHAQILIETNHGSRCNSKHGVLAESLFVLGRDRGDRRFRGGAPVVKHLDDKHRLSYHITARVEPLPVALKDRQPFWKSRRDDGA